MGLVNVQWDDIRVPSTVSYTVELVGPWIIGFQGLQTEVQSMGITRI
jgi:hypothetical protein